MIATAKLEHDQPDRAAGPHAGSALVIELLASTAVERAAREWQSLEQRLNNETLACSWVWTKTWLDSFGDLTPHRFVVAKANDQVCGICLLTEGVDQTDGPVAVKTLHVGTAGEPDRASVCVEYNQLLVEPQHRTGFVAALLDIFENEPQWDELRFDGFAEDELAELLSIEEGDRVRHSLSRYFDLEAAREKSPRAMDQLGHSTRKNIRKNLNAYGELEVEWSETLEQAQAIFEDLVRLHQARWTAVGEPGSYADERFLAFHQSLVRELAPLGKLALMRIRQHGETLACVEILIDRNRALVYQGGWSGGDEKRSPGLIVDYLCLEECFRRGYDAFDFLGGDSHHKQKLSTDARQLVWVGRRRPRLKFKMLDAARSLKRKVGGHAK